MARLVRTAAGGAAGLLLAGCGELVSLDAPSPEGTSGGSMQTGADAVTGPGSVGSMDASTGSDDDGDELPGPDLPVDPPAVWQRRFAAAGLDLVEHQYYFSARAHRAFDASHYLGVGNLVSRKLTGRWVPHPAVGRAFERWLRRYAEEPVPQPTGAYQFVRAVRVDEEGGGPA